MAKAISESVPYILIGSRAGQSGVFFGFPFRDGHCDVPAEAHASCGHVLVNHYAALPLSEAIAQEIVDKNGNPIDQKAGKDKGK